MLQVDNDNLKEFLTTFVCNKLTVNATKIMQIRSNINENMTLKFK